MKGKFVGNIYDAKKALIEEGYDFVMLVQESGYGYCAICKVSSLTKKLAKFTKDLTLYQGWSKNFKWCKFYNFTDVFKDLADQMEYFGASSKTTWQELLALLRSTGEDINYEE